MEKGILKMYEDLLNCSDSQLKAEKTKQLQLNLFQITLDVNSKKEDVEKAKTLIQLLSVDLKPTNEYILELKKQLFFVREFDEVDKSIDLAFSTVLRSDWADDKEMRIVLLDSYKILKTALVFIETLPAHPRDIKNYTFSV